MSSKQQSEQSSTTSSSSLPPRSLIVSKVSLAKDETWLYNDLSHTYPDIKKVSRNYDQDGRELNSIQVDFHSEEIVSEILDEEAIYIENRPYYIRPFWPVICYRCQNEGHKAAECPQRSLPEWRLAELLHEQKTNFETLINGFENRWNTRILTLKRPANTTNIDQFMPAINDLTTICHQLNQHNIQMQKQLSTITSRIQNMQTEVKN